MQYQMLNFKYACSSRHPSFLLLQARKDVPLKTAVDTFLFFPCRISSRRLEPCHKYHSPNRIFLSSQTDNAANAWFAANTCPLIHSTLKSTLTRSVKTVSKIAVVASTI